MPKIRNPVLATEDFNRHWDQRQYANFRDRIKSYAQTAKQAKAEPSAAKAIKLWQELFGDQVREVLRTPAAVGLRVKPERQRYRCWRRRQPQLRTRRPIVQRPNEARRFRVRIAMTGRPFLTRSPSETFEDDLAAAGFEPVAVVRILPGWRGPIHRAFAGLTNATTMDVVILPGWPFRPPALFVEGLDTNHLTPRGFVCLWQDGDPSGDWETVEGFFTRLEEWCENANREWEGDDLQGDAFLNFTKKFSTVATFNLSELGIPSGDVAELRGRVNRDSPRVEVVSGRPNLPNQLRGLGFHVGSLNTPPPRQLSEVFHCLSRKQSGRLKRALDDRRRAQPFMASGGLDLILLCWERQAGLTFW